MTRIQSVRRIPGANASGNFWARAALVTSIVAFAMVGPAMADREGDDDEAYAIGLWGDLPYNARTGHRCRSWASPNRECRYQP